ncbi:MAG: uroporphyrinogen decarboxylase family protein [Christensenellales bacterium]|jgi:uroporphyrinogen decarboxylase
MTQRERFLCALDLGTPDRVPTFELEFQLEEELLGKPFLREKMLEGLTKGAIETKLRENAQYLIEVYDKLEHDAICVHYLSREHLYRTVELLREYSGDKYAIFCHGDGTLAIPDGNGLEELAVAMYEEPEALLERAERMMKDAMARNEHMRAAGVDGFILCSDYCFNQGPFMSPDMFAKFVTPYLKELTAHIRGMGAYAIKHTDGNIMPILDQLVSTNPHALHSIDPMAGVDIREVKRLYGDRVALCGNVHCAHLQTGTDQQVIDSCEYCLTYAKPGGGYVFATSNIPFKGMKLERYLMVLDVWRRMRDY